MKKNNKGFSLVELIVVIAIMAILAAIAIPTFAHFITKANESSDAELLHNINYIFDAACLENGVDVKDVTAATWDMETMLVTSVNGDANHPIVGSFETHFDLTGEKFYYIENLAFNPDKHEFVDAQEVVNVFSEIFGSIENIDALVQALQNSTFGTIGAESLMAKVDTVTGLAATLAGQNGTFATVLTGNLDSLAQAMGYEGSNDTEFQTAFDALVQQKMQDMGIDDEDAATQQILANYAVLQAAKSTTGNASDLLNTLNTNNSVETVKGLMSNSDPNTQQEGLSQAAMMYAMYTAYANQLPDSTEEEKAAKDTALANATDVSKFIDAMNDEGFQNYLADTEGTGQAEKDMEGYLAALEIINQSANSSPDAVSDLVVDGYSNHDLIDAMDGLLG